MRFYVSTLLLAIAAVVIPLAAHGDEPQTTALGPHQRVMHLADDAGHEQPIRTAADWARRRSGIVKGMEAVMGPLPAEMRRDGIDAPTPAPFDLRVLAETEQEGVPRQTISFISRKNERVTAFLYVPKGIAAGERRAAIVALQPTGKEGKQIVAGLIEQYGGKPNRRYALELAQRGYIVIAPDYVSFGDATDHDFDRDDYESGTMKAIVDDMRCVDYLQSRPDVDPARIGSIGHSLGGHNAVFHAVFDVRVKAIVSSCGWTPFHDYYGGLKLQNWAQARYMPFVTSRFANDPNRMPFDFYELIAALAPRAFFSCSPLHDGNFDYRGVKKAVREARPVFNLLGAPLALQARYPDCGHDFPNPQRREAYAFLDAALKHKPTGNFPALQFAERRSIEIVSTLDGTKQPSFVFVPKAYDRAAPAVPLLVGLHSWSGDYHQQAPEIMEAANLKGWIYLTPNFRGPNSRPEACGSKLAQQDILDAVEWACREYHIDRDRIYLTGSSGGGHMTLQMVGNHPHVWAAASAWVGISDVLAWHEMHKNDKYGEMLRQSCGGPPGASTAVDEEYRLRSPATHLAAAKTVPLDIGAGIYDGHHGSVPVSHSLRAFNVVAAANGDAPIDDATIEKLSHKRWWTNAPTVEGESLDPMNDRTIYFRRESGLCRVTLFEGGHERVDTAVVPWLDGKVRGVKREAERGK
jgi:dienelactone hydrolase